MLYNIIIHVKHVNMNMNMYILLSSYIVLKYFRFVPNQRFFQNDSDFFDSENGFAKKAQGKKRFQPCLN